MAQIYFDGFASDNRDWMNAKQGWAAVQSEFETDEPEPDEVIIAEYDLSEPYEGCANVIYRRGSKFYYASGSHCSCYGLEGQWEPEEYTAEQLIGQAERANYGAFKKFRDRIIAAAQGMASEGPRREGGSGA